MGDVTESLCEYYGDVDGYQHLYVVVDKLSRATEALRGKQV